MVENFRQHKGRFVSIDGYTGAAQRGDGGFAQDPQPATQKDGSHHNQGRQTHFAVSGVHATATPRRFKRAEARR